MRRPRLLAPDDQPTAVYHCYSRIVDRRPILHEADKELFRSLMVELAEFCQVRILTFCIMSNHFHILLEVPRPPEHLPGVEETLEALAKLSGAKEIGALRQQVAAFRAAGDGAAETLWLSRYHARRWSLSNYMKLLKQRFSAMYNRKAKRKGTLWEERFRSVLVEGEGRALVTMAAYIDLNPVRARMVEDPKDYRWCGYREAVTGHPGALEGIKRVVEVLLRAEGVGAEESLRSYRKHLFVEGDEVGESIGEDLQTVRGAISHEAVLKVLAEGGQISTGNYLRCRVRYFCDGAIFGTRDFVEKIFRRCRDRFGSRRKTGARPLRGMAERGLFTARALRVDVFG